MITMKGGVVTITDSSSFIENLEKLTKRAVYAGVPAADTTRKPEHGVPAIITNAAIGYISEFGSSTMGIPPRPWLRSGIIEGKRSIMIHLKRAAIAVTKPGAKPADIEKYLHMVGLATQNALRRKISVGPFTPLAASTIRRRKQKYPTRANISFKPLIDTAQFQRSVTYVIRKA